MMTKLFNLPLARNGGTTVVGSGEEGIAEARRSSGRVCRSRMIALWWMLVSERERRENGGWRREEEEEG